MISLFGIHYVNAVQMEHTEISVKTIRKSIWSKLVYEPMPNNIFTSYSDFFYPTDSQQPIN
jgi:hypothetical protein